MSGPTAISLFSGLGGIDIGLHRAGVKTLVAVDNNENAVETLRANSLKYGTGVVGKKTPYDWTVLEEDIHKVTHRDLLDAAGTDDIDFIVGGPPCQTFSRSNEGNREGTDSTRGMLFQEFARLLRDIEPEGFVFENVRGLASANDGEDIKVIKQEFESCGYTINEDVLNAADFGVPQTRKRLFIIGFRNNQKPYFPEPTHVEAQNPLTGKSTWVTAGEALSDFDIDAEIMEDTGYENAVGGKYGYLLQDIPPGANYQHFSERKYNTETGEYIERPEDEFDEKMFDWRSRHYNYLLKQDPDRPTWTLQAAPGTYVGPFHWRSRRYSFLEQMRLMDIPVDYEICGPPREIQRQIGNAVPSGLIECIIQALMNQLDLGVHEIESPRDSIPTRGDGQGISTDGNQPFQIQARVSPWEYTEEIIELLNEDNEVIICGRGKNIAQVIDVLELTRRRLSDSPNISLTESVVENPNGSKSDRLSLLTAEISL